MNKTFSKLALPLIVLANVSPVIATTKYQNISSSKQHQVYQATPEKIQIAGIFDDIEDSVDDVTDTVDDVHETKHGVEERDLEIEERKAQEEERKRAQEEYEAARKAAQEREIQEAERRRAYFESLSPEEQQAYIQKKREREAEQTEAFIDGMGVIFGGGGNGGEGNPNTTTGCEHHELGTYPNCQPNPDAF